MATIWPLWGYAAPAVAVLILIWWWIKGGRT